MTREENLVNTILADGKKEAKKLVLNAKKEGEKIVKLAQREKDEFFAREIEEFKQQKNLELENKKRFNNLEKNKIVLKTKNELLKEVFDLALEKLKSLSKKDYKKFLSDVLKHANKNDKLKISSRKGEKEIISKLDIFKEKKLVIEEVSESISGGVVIFNDIYEKDFSFESLILEKFENSSFRIAKLLF